MAGAMWRRLSDVGQTSVCGGLQPAPGGAEAPRRLKPAPQTECLRHDYRKEAAL
jgi:hypothetical protein